MLNFYGKTFSSRLLIGSALYPSPAIMQDAIRASGANIVTVSLRREAAGGKTGDAFWSLIRELDVTVLPNTAGCRSVREAVTTAKLARELFGTPWIKLEVIADNDTLQPDVVGLVEAAGILIKDSFEVFPYCTEDLSVAMRLVDADLVEIRKAGLTLGISTHDDEELAAALRAEPDYIALGPIFPTTLKSMRFAPQGIAKITEWKKRVGNIPLVAIGGIKFEQAAEIFAAGADSIAVVSDVTQNADPDARVRAWLGMNAKAA